MASNSSVVMCSIRLKGTVQMGLFVRDFLGLASLQIEWFCEIENIHGC